MKSVTCDYMNNLNNRKLSFTDLIVLEVTILEVVWMFYLLIQMIEGKLHIWSIIFTIPMYITFKKLQVNKQCKITSFYCYLGVVMFEKRIWLYTRNVYHSVLRTEDSSFVISWKNAIKLST